MWVFKYLLNKCGKQCGKRVVVLQKSLNKGLKFLTIIDLVWYNVFVIIPHFMFDFRENYMKKAVFALMVLIANILCLSGCEIVTNKTMSLSVVYFIVAILSLVPLICYCFFASQKDKWFVLLISAVFVVNVGYFVLSISTTLEQALLANRIAYLGSAFLPFAMFMILLGVAKVSYKKWLPIFLIVLSVVMFLIAATPGYCDLYYKEVSLYISNGNSTLNKVYGPLHIVYTIYLLGYFITIIATTVYSFIKKVVVTPIHSLILFLATFVNIGVWFFEQISNFDFEFLSISYIISELFLLSLHYIIKENQKLKSIVNDINKNENILTKPTVVSVVNQEQIDYFISGIEKLTPTEKAIYNEHVKRKTTKEILTIFNIKENTLKFHNKNIYSKLGVSSKKELVEISKHI